MYLKWEVLMPKGPLSLNLIIYKNERRPVTNCALEEQGFFSANKNLEHEMQF